MTVSPVLKAYVRWTAGIIAAGSGALAGLLGANGYDKAAFIALGVATVAGAVAAVA